MILKLDRVKEQAEDNSYSIALDLDDRLFLLMGRDADRGIQGESISMEHEGRCLTLPITRNVTDGETVSNVGLQLTKVIEEELRKYLGYNYYSPKFFVNIAKGLTGQLSYVVDKARRNMAEAVLSIVIQDSEKRELYLSSVRSASNAISTEITKLHDDIGYALGKIDENKVGWIAKVIGRIHNSFSLGSMSRSMNKELDNLYERLLGWQLLNECVNPYANVLKADAQALQRQGDGELAKQFENLSSFYHQLGTQVGYAEKRMGHLVNDYLKAWSMFGLVQERDDFSSIKDKLVNRINNPNKSSISVIM